MADSVTSSALSTAPDDLIEPSAFAQDPPSSSVSITDSIEDSVGLDLARLPSYRKVPLAKKPRSSWIWEHGYELQKKDNTRWWVCRICHRAKVSNAVKPHIYSAKASTNAASHMERHHADVDAVRLRIEEARTPTIADQLRRSVIKESTLITPFSAKQFKSALLEWIIHDDITFRQAASTRLRTLLLLASPMIEPVLPHTHSTVSIWIHDLFEVKKREVREVLRGTETKTNLSFDLWTSGNYLPLLAIVAHFIDNFGFLKVILLSLPELHGPHTGENIAAAVGDVIEAYGIGDKIGFFTTDNAENNDTCLAALGARFGFDVSQRRLRCAGHIINLVAKAFLYGTNLSSFESELAGASEQQETPQRRALFKSKQAETFQEGGPETLYEAAVDGGIRWNSTEYMIERALKLRNAVDLYCMDQVEGDPKSTLNGDVLKRDDWADLSQFFEVLQPFKIATKRLEGNATTGSHGALWEVITTMDFLLEKLEGYRARLQDVEDTEDNEAAVHEREHFKTSINQAWAVLNKYYKLSDETPAYRAAVVLNPRFKMEYFRTKWEDRPLWITEAEISVKNLWNEYKAKYHVPVSTSALKEKS